MSADNHIEDLVLNAVPDLSETSNAPWVEWFKIGEKIYHHIIFTKVNKKSKMMGVKAGRQRSS
jgi:hypothetical protein|tara:strand:- start:213 stop:401 length:189 start_codon:yes stop_codon:yes gene_type:complete